MGTICATQNQDFLDSFRTIKFITVSASTMLQPINTSVGFLSLFIEQFLCAQVGS